MLATRLFETGDIRTVVDQEGRVIGFERRPYLANQRHEIPARQIFFSKLYTVPCVSSLPETTMSFPSGETSTPCGLFGSGTSVSTPSAAATSIGKTFMPAIVFVFPAATSSSAFFQFTTWR